MLRLKTLAAFAALCCLACSGASAGRLQPLAPSAVVLAFGDSITHGTGAAKGASYPAVLQRLIGRTVVNAGVPGELSGQGLDRLRGLLERYRPGLVIICHGGNDLLQERPFGQVKENIAQMILLCRGRGAQVALIAVPAFREPLASAPFYAELAGRFSLPCENAVLSRVLGSSALKSDYVHPNGQGYAKIAAAVAELLKKEGAIGGGLEPGAAR